MSSYYDSVDETLKINKLRAIVLQKRYQITNLIGEGGMGAIYLALDLRLGKRKCILKKLKEEYFKQEDRNKALAFFQREAQILSSLQHPNIVHVYDFFEEDEQFYLVMEYIEGKNLEQLLYERGRPFDENTVAKWSLQILDVFNYLHNHNPPVIYRDLKPSNIMLNNQSNIKLIDFGIARPFYNDEEKTHVVSQGYSPPEQYWGASEPRSDLYSLGCTMYFLLTGMEPKALQICSPKAIVTELSPAIDLVVQTATSQDINSRYQTAEQMKSKIEVKSFKKEFLGYRLKGLIVIFCLLLLTSVVVVAFTQLLTTQSPINEKSNNLKNTQNYQNIRDFSSIEPKSKIINDPDLFK